MKRLLIALLCLCLILSFSGCNEAVPTGGNLSSDVTAKPSSGNDSSSAEASQSEEGLASESEISLPESTVSTPEKTETPNTDVTSSEDNKKEATESKVQVDSETLMAVINGYNVFDPYNSRGLSTKGYGYSYGIAKDGKPHTNSLENQKRFDGYKTVKALAVDTVSNDKRMYLTFDCGYEYKNLTGDILDVLKEKNVKAAFFCTLDYLKKNPKLVRRMIDEGHIVGNHSATHPVFTQISRSQMAKEIYLVEDYLEKNFNYYSPYFRFPTGEYSESALDLVSSTGYCSVFWSVAHADWDTGNQPTVENTIKNITDRFHSGAVILLHAVSESNTKALAKIIDNAATQGYTFKSLDDYKAK